MIHYMPQHSDEWFAVRAGKFTASNAATIMGGTETKGLNDLIKSVAWERAYGIIDEPRYQSAAMQRGNENEASARNWYTFVTGKPIVEVGFVDGIENVGWSPDGVVINDGRITHAIEIKSLLHKAYMDVLVKKEVPSEYRWQCRWAMWVGELEKMDFVVHHPQAGGIIIEVEQKQIYIEHMEERVALAEKLVAEWVERLVGKQPPSFLEAEKPKTTYEIQF